MFNYIKEDVNAASGETIPRKYFSGGISVADGAASAAMLIVGHNITKFQMMAATTIFSLVTMFTGFGPVNSLASPVTNNVPALVQPANFLSDNQIASTESSLDYNLVLNSSVVEAHEQTNAAMGAGGLVLGMIGMLGSIAAAMIWSNSHYSYTDNNDYKIKLRYFSKKTLKDFDPGKYKPAMDERFFARATGVTVKEATVIDGSVKYRLLYPGNTIPKERESNIEDAAMAVNSYIFKETTRINTQNSDETVVLSMLFTLGAVIKEVGLNPLRVLEKLQANLSPEDFDSYVEGMSLYLYGEALSDEEFTKRVSDIKSQPQQILLSKFALDIFRTIAEVNQDKEGSFTMSDLMQSFPLVKGQESLFLISRALYTIKMSERLNIFDTITFTNAAMTAGELTDSLNDILKYFGGINIGQFSKINGVESVLLLAVRLLEVRGFLRSQASLTPSDGQLLEEIVASFKSFFAQFSRNPETAIEQFGTKAQEFVTRIPDHLFKESPISILLPRHFRYLAQPGELLSDIANRSGTTIEALVMANKHSPDGELVIPPGEEDLRLTHAQKIWIVTSADQFTYVVDRPGSSINSIGRLLDVPYRKLAMDNGIYTPEAELALGRQLKVNIRESEVVQEEKKGISDNRVVKKILRLLLSRVKHNEQNLHDAQGRLMTPLMYDNDLTRDAINTIMSKMVIDLKLKRTHLIEDGHLIEGFVYENNNLKIISWLEGALEDIDRLESDQFTDLVMRNQILVDEGLANVLSGSVIDFGGPFKEYLPGNIRNIAKRNLVAFNGRRDLVNNPDSIGLLLQEKTTGETYGVIISQQEFVNILRNMAEKNMALAKQIFTRLGPIGDKFEDQQVILQGLKSSDLLVKASALEAASEFSLFDTKEAVKDLLREPEATTEKNAIMQKRAAIVTAGVVLKYPDQYREFVKVAYLILSKAASNHQELVQESLFEVLISNVLKWHNSSELNDPTYSVFLNAPRPPSLKLAAIVDNHYDQFNNFSALQAASQNRMQQTLRTIINHEYLPPDGLNLVRQYLERETKPQKTRIGRITEAILKKAGIINDKEHFKTDLARLCQNSNKKERTFGCGYSFGSF